MAGRFHKNRIHKKNTVSPIRLILIREMKLLKSYYPFLDCKIISDKLICIGKTKPSDLSVEYTFKLIYDGVTVPRVYIVSPQVEYNDDIHIYPEEKNLCLYHPLVDNFIWNYKKDHIYDTILPWTLEWFVYYELYLISGKWEHPFIPHTTNKSID
ncbi:hypothetical protein GCM10011344_26830 [Dokdonia pacifica]|uniref:Type II CBASS E2 protein domain-containing protein n=2 Tax=Dokdonia pacifica TaxID=1627892 RepID=A0A239DYS8_9FLAO|nr:hypothetical protein GCM10011344_26830 [Dokdonia pacifica]SNS37626.1 hypothetical protein SAMN06265376_11313 [Dokdonia pacifica]